MSELKDSREAFLRESEISTKAIVDILRAEIQKEITAASKLQQKNQQAKN